VCYFDENGRRHREKVGPKALATKVYQKRKNEVQERRFFPERIRRRDVLLADFFKDYLARVKGRLRCYREYERYAKRLASAFPGRTLRQLLPGDIDRYVAKRLQEVSPATVNRDLQFLKHVFYVAMKDGLCERNPVREVRLFKENNQRVRFLTEDEEAQLREAVGEDEWPMVAVAIHTGLRQAEQFNLRWEHVDFTTGIITIPRSKHGEARRIPMNDTVRDLLRALPSRLKSALVFPSTTGETAVDARNYMNRVFVPALEKARIAGFRWHDLRHTFASRLVMKGVDLRTVQELLGHKTMAMTLRYSHLSPGHQLDAVRRLDAATDDRGTATGTATEQPGEKAATGGRAEVLDLPVEPKCARPDSNGEPAGSKPEDRTHAARLKPSEPREDGTGNRSPRCEMGGDGLGAGTVGAQSGRGPEHLRQGGHRVVSSRGLRPCGGRGAPDWEALETVWQAALEGSAEDRCARRNRGASQGEKSLSRGRPAAPDHRRRPLRCLAPRGARALRD